VTVDPYNMADDAAEQLRRLLAHMGVSTVEEAEEKYDDMGRTVQRLDGKAFCTMGELFSPVWEPYTKDDFTTLCRNWEEIVADRNKKKSAEENDNQNENFDKVFQVYDKTRTAAMADGTRVSATCSLMTVGSLKPVRLCSHQNVQNYAEKAHLCPKTGVLRKVDTWIYVAAAVLGMPAESSEDREALLKALRGSVKEGKSSVSHQTGLNRSPFNLMSFLLQETWFDKHPGVIVLPCMDPAAARNWRGESYSIIILCRDVPSVSTAADVANGIGLGKTPPENLHTAKDTDIHDAMLLLRQVLLSSAFCLTNKDGPPNISQGHKKSLWDTYKEGLVSHQHAAYVVDGDESFLSSVMIPDLRTIPEGRFVAKINLSEMTLPEDESTPAYPDPLLMAWKSSVNWTRAFGFQMIAEAETPEDDVDRNPQIPGMVVMVDKGSVATPDDGSSVRN